MLSSGAVFVVYKDLLLESPCSTGPRARPSDGSRSTTGHISDSGAGCGKVEILETLHMEYKMKRFLSWVGLALLLAAGQASANIIYTFSGVTFSDGGTLTGTFTTNDTSTTLLDFDITTSAAPGIGF